jgi:poly-gamma-glutamate capsule biosynthesis protein CapA/YwtB (metallophosphatase superfamily)
MKLLFTGDINFRGIENLNYNASKEILSEVQPYLDAVDFRISNLETPLADKSKYTPIKKSGPNLICEPDNIVFLKAMKADAVTLANNHIGDYGEGAIEATLKLLDSNGIMHAGAGEDINDAYKPCYLKKDNICIAVLSVCENEFGMATEQNYGSAGYNARTLLRRIKEEKKNADYIIVVFHGGNEFCPIPSQDTIDRYRLICDMGADAVIGGHTHCPQGYEIYDGKPIVYSMGNFLFQSSVERSPNNSWYYGYMCILDIKDCITLEIIPYKFDLNATKIEVFNSDFRLKMLSYIEKLSRIIHTPSELSQYYKGWVWLHRWCPSLPKDMNDIQKYNASGNLNLIMCESHLSQLKELLIVLYNNEIRLAQEWSENIKKLQIMPA